MLIFVVNQGHAVWGRMAGNGNRKGKTMEEQIVRQSRCLEGYFDRSVVRCDAFASHLVAADVLIRRRRMGTCAATVGLRPMAGFRLLSP